MTDSGDTADTLEKRKAMKAEFVRILSARVQDIRADPRQARNLVYELGRIKLSQQFDSNSSDTWQVLRTLESAIREVEQSFADADQAEAASASADPASGAPELSGIEPASAESGNRTRRVQPPAQRADGARRNPFASLTGMAAFLTVVALICGAILAWPRLQSHLPQLSRLMDRGERLAPSKPAQAPAPVQPTPAPEPAPGTSGAPAAPVEHAMPLPTTFGVYALSEGQLQELKALPGKVPDRRVAISAAISTPSATTLASGDVKFIVFKPEGAVDASATEVRVVARVSRAMGVDASGKAAMVNAGDSWVIRSMSFPYKVGPVEEQPRMLLLQPEQDSFALTPGRYVVVVKGIGYDFTVAGEATDPAQCVERINAANGAFYSPCPPR